MQISMKPTYRNIVNSYVSFVSSAEPDSVYIVEIYDVEHALFFVLIIFRKRGLRSFYNNIICYWFLNFKYLVAFFAYFEDIFKFFFAKLTMKRLPRISSDISSNFFIFNSWPPLLETFDMYIFHAARAFTRRQQRIIFLNLFIKTDPASLLIWIFTPIFHWW